MEKIRIPKPCHENWNMMSAEEKGRHCAVCNKVVVDFTQNSVPEIHQFLQNHSTQKVCGRFNFEDIEQPVKHKNWFQRKAIDFYYFIGKNQFSGIAASFSALLLLLVGCKKEVTGELDARKDSTVCTKDSMNDILMGKPSVYQKKDTAQIPPPLPIVGEVVMPESVPPKDSLNKSN